MHALAWRRRTETLTTMQTCLKWPPEKRRRFTCPFFFLIPSKISIREKDLIPSVDPQWRSS